MDLCGSCPPPDLTDADTPFLGTALGRPANERPFVVIPGRPAPGARVPAIIRKPLHEVLVEV